MIPRWHRHPLCEVTVTVSCFLREFMQSCRPDRGELVETSECLVECLVRITRVKRTYGQEEKSVVERKRRGPGCLEESVLYDELNMAFQPRAAPQTQAHGSRLLAGVAIEIAKLQVRSGEPIVELS